MGQKGRGVKEVIAVEKRAGRRGWAERRRAVTGGVALVWLAVGLSSLGCYEERVVRRSLDDLRSLADPKPLPPGAGYGRDGQDPALAGATYAIRVGEYVGVGGGTSARVALDEVQRATGLEGGWMRDTGRSVTAYLGRFSDPEGQAATEALRSVRASGIDQTARANLVPISAGQAAVTDPLDARGHRGMHSLQVAVYDADFGDTFRLAAQRAAKALREQGEEAFYYHGPHRSMVLIGLFTREVDFSTTTGSLGEQIEVYGPRISKLQDEYPYNLLNGHAQHLHDEHGNRMEDRPLESFIVRIM
jgi:hypothetical protein